MEKTLNLRVHKRSFNENSNLNEEILINQKDVPDVIIGDVVEIYHIEDEESRLLLQVTSLSDEFQQKGTVSIEQSIANTFQLRAYKDVIVKKVDPKGVALDLVEMLFKDQYFSRSDFWRLRNGIIGTCVYLNKKIEHAEMRQQVMEMWSKGERVMCGTITEETRIVYRSSTAVVQIFIQMSSEMWDFDILGEDLYFEKALNGFLTDLFAKWKEQNCQHDVTIVLFSRTFYKAQSLDEFPEYMRDCIVCDYKGRYYQDFYRIVVQNERYDDWTSTMILLRKLCNSYKEKILNYHKQKGHKAPIAYNSTAAQGNFLETLNMSLNLFEGYYIDRNFDRTGKVAVVITPGAGVFEVDRELANITKQRTIDCGIGSDLVCMGEQPLHAAPLFKFHNKLAKTSLEVGDDYNIPHWMNHSFYISKSQIKAQLQGSFIPRIKPPPEFNETQRRSSERKLLAHSPNKQTQDENNIPFVDYDEYDAQIWKLPTPNSTRFGSLKFSYQNRRQPQTMAEAKQIKKPRKRNVSDDYPSMAVEKGERRGSPAINIPILSRSSSSEDISSSVGCYPIIKKPSSKESNESAETDDSFFMRRIVGSAESPVGYSRKHIHQAKSRRALINPFAPSRMQFKMTSNRRRWVHAFPTDPQGAAVQTHHFHIYNKRESSATLEKKLSRDSLKMSQLSMDMKTQSSFSTFDITEKFSESSSLNRIPSGFVSEDKFYVGSVDSSPTSSVQNLERLFQGASLSSTIQYNSASDLGSQGGHGVKKARENRSYLWGPTGEQEWSPDMTTGQDWFPAHGCQTDSCLVKPILTADIHSQNFCAGISVDWKSLTMPASLPITTDYFPDKRSLENDYTVSQYTLIPEDVNSEYYSSPPVTEDDKFYRRRPLSVTELFRELISQRLAQGFQIITKKKPPKQSMDAMSVGASPQFQHTSSLIRARPRSGPQEEIYLSIGLIFHKLTLSGQTIQVTQYRPRHEQRQLKYLYHYRFQVPDSPSYDVSTSQFKNEKLENYNWNYLDQYICTRGEGDYGLLDPLKYWRSRFFLLPCNNPATRKILEGNDRCDIYQMRSKQELQQLISGFVRFLETLNKMRRTAQTRRQKHSGDNVSSTPTSDQQTSQASQKEAVLLSVTMASFKLIEAMKDPQTGLSMLPSQTGLPESCFIAEEAVDWCIQNIQEVKDVISGIGLMQRLQDEHYICHSSGNPQHKFIHGFYLYNIVSPKDKPKSDIYGPNYNYLFQNEWCEVSILPVVRERAEVPLFTMEESPCQVSELWVNQLTNDWRVLSGIDTGAQGWGQQSGSRVNLCAMKATLTHKYVQVDVDGNNKSDRPEWASARYHAYYSPNAAFELQLQWMVATGPILQDLVTTWGRKAQACGFHLLPVPGDPFALPSAPDSDPLRGPIFVPLDIASLSQGGKPVFHDLDQVAKSKKLLHFQDEIIKRYGFMPINVCVSETHRHYMSDEQQQYVHCTGGMFILMESSHVTSSPKVIKTSSRINKKSAGELRKDYIARQNSNTSNMEVVTQNKVGFLWSWNFMSSKRWRSPNTGDEIFQDRMLADFRQFCANENNRLKEFWNDFNLMFAL